MARADKAIALHKAGQFQKAIALYRKLEPEARRSAEFWCLYGDALLRVNKTRQAADCFEKALTLSPGNPAALGPLSIALVTLKRYRDAEGVLRNLIARNSGDSIAKINLARVLVETNRPKEANETLGNVSKAGLGPSELAILLETRVDALLGEERYAEAISTTQEIVRTQSEKTQDRVAALRRLLNVATSARAGTITLSTLDALKAEGATEKFDAAQRGNAFSWLYQPHQAYHWYTLAVEQNPEALRTRQALLQAALYLPNITLPEIYRTNNEYGQLVAKQHRSKKTNQRPLRVAADNEPLRLGFSSADFTTHPVAIFMAPVFEELSRRDVVFHCYYERHYQDPYTERIRSLCTEWRVTADLDDAAFIDAVRKDKLDILVDLSGHTDQSRINAFAHRMAPCRSAGQVILRQQGCLRWTTLLLMQCRSGRVTRPIIRRCPFGCLIIMYALINPLRMLNCLWKRHF